MGLTTISYVLFTLYSAFLQWPFIFLYSRNSKALPYGLFFSIWISAKIFFFSQNSQNNFFCKYFKLCRRTLNKQNPSFKKNFKDAFIFNLQYLLKFLLTNMSQQSSTLVYFGVDTLDTRHMTQQTFNYNHIWKFKI